MKAVQDFNYKVALASGLKHLQAGKLRKAEEQFRYLVAKFPHADGGYRGLARVQVELGDHPAALGTLRDGAAALSRSGERVVAIDLLREATSLDPLDLSAHRRLAATLALVGDVGAAAQEYVRFASAEVAAGDPERARLEASYALETLGEIPALHDLARTVGLQLRTVRRLPAEPEPVTAAEPEPATAEPAYPEPAAPEPEWIAPAEPVTQPPWAMPGGPAEDPRLAVAAGWAASRPASVHERAEPRSLEDPAAPSAPQVDPLELEARAVSLIASRDADAGRVAVEAARALIDAGKVHAASDLLLHLVAAGIAVHDAERELVRVARALGRGEIAAERERLLGTVASLG